MLLKRLNALEGLTSEEVRLLVALGPGSFVLASTIGTINVGLPAVQDEAEGAAAIERLAERLL